jgi:hypothetical protein
VKLVWLKVLAFCCFTVLSFVSERLKAKKVASASAFAFAGTTANLSFFSSMLA